MSSLEKSARGFPILHRRVLNDVTVAESSVWSGKCKENIKENYENVIIVYYVTDSLANYEDSRECLQQLLTQLPKR